MICKWIISFLNELELICLHTCIAIVSTQLNVLIHCYLTLIILFICLHTVKWLQALLFNTNNSIQHY